MAGLDWAARHGCSSVTLQHSVFSSFGRLAALCGLLRVDRLFVMWSGKATQGWDVQIPSPHIPPWWYKKWYENLGVG